MDTRKERAIPPRPKGAGLPGPVSVIEHHLDVIRNADWIIDMGPEGGNKGGAIIFEGTPRELLGAQHSLTSKYLR
jgi:excinuclease UvrABC ATPase subunit